MENTINAISHYLKKELNLSTDQMEVVAYGITIFFSTILGYASILIVGYLLGVLKLALVAAITASGLRVLSGGAHSENIRNCSLLGAVVSPGLAVLAKSLYDNISFPFFVIIIVIVLASSIRNIFKYAPADTPNRPITDHKLKKRFRKLSYMYLICWSVFMFIGLSDIISVGRDLLLSSTLGLMWQTFSLSPLGYIFVARIDDLLQG